MSILEPSLKCGKEKRIKHKTTIDWAMQVVKVLSRWVRIPTILIGDGYFASAKLAWTCIRKNITLIARLKMNARIYDFPTIDPHKRGRKSTKGTRLKNFNWMKKNKHLFKFQKIEVEGYGNQKKIVKYITATSLWGADSFHPVPIRWVFVLDNGNGIPLMCTDVKMDPKKYILEDGVLKLHSKNLENT